MDKKNKKDSAKGYKRTYIKDTKSLGNDGLDGLKPDKPKPSGFELEPGVRVRTPGLGNCALPRLERKDQALMSITEKENFNNIITRLIADGSYGELVNFHSGNAMVLHMMHGKSLPFGIARFIPWHTIYLYELELLISNYDNTVKIPYWDWIKDPIFPHWLLQPEGVTRWFEGNLPSKEDVLGLYRISNFSDFSTSLEDYHGMIHGYVGSTMASFDGSPADPAFFLHHAYVDKIWRDWQKIYPNEMQTIDGVRNVLDPWEDTIDDAQNISSFCTVYSGLKNWDAEISKLFVTRSTSEQINSESDQNLTDIISNILDSFTGNSDKQAIFKILNSVSCERLARIINRVGTDRIFSELNGTEDAELILLLAECSLIRFSFWNDIKSRAFINEINCSQINSLANQNLIDLIGNMLEGDTPDNDERAILKILNCLTCTRLTVIVQSVSQDRLLLDLHGAEDTELRILLGKCGLMSFASWNDSVTRAFVNEVNCSEINQLSNASLVALIENMIEGDTPDNDEIAILKILNCLNCTRLGTIVSSVRKSVLLDNLHGAEDTQLRDLFSSCGI